MLKNLNSSQERILTYLRKRAQDGVPPSVREICSATGLKSTSTVHSHLKFLERNGYISRQAGLNRAIHISGSNVVRVPIVNRFNKDTLTFSAEDVDGYIPYNDISECDNEFFAVRVNDSNMRDVGIFRNDVAIAKVDSVPRNGDLSILLYDNRILVRIFHINKSYNYFLSENPVDFPIFFDDAKVLGKVVSIVRYY